MRGPIRPRIYFKSTSDSVMWGLSFVQFLFLRGQHMQCSSIKIRSHLNYIFYNTISQIGSFKNHESRFFRGLYNLWLEFFFIILKCQWNLMKESGETFCWDSWTKKIFLWFIWWGTSSVGMLGWRQYIGNKGGQTKISKAKQQILGGRLSETGLCSCI